MFGWPGFFWQKNTHIMKFWGTVKHTHKFINMQNIVFVITKQIAYHKLYLYKIFIYIAIIFINICILYKYIYLTYEAFLKLESFSIYTTEKLIMDKYHRENNIHKEDKSPYVGHYIHYGYCNC